TADPLRTEMDAGMSPLPMDTLDWAFERVHLEDDVRLLPSTVDVFKAQDPHWSIYDTWLWTWTGRGGAVTVTAEADHVRPGKQARVWGKLFHWFGDKDLTRNHNLTIRVNDGAALDSITFDYGQQGLLAGSTVSDSIREGANRIFIDNHPVVDPQSDLAFDWAELEYPRYLDLDDGWKVFEADADMGEGLRMIKLQNLGKADPTVLRVTPDGRVRLLPVAAFSFDSSYTVLVADTVITGAQYFVAVDSTLRLPQPGAVTAREPLVQPGERSEYLILTAAEFTGATAEYAQFIEQTYGLQTRVVDVTDIYDEYSYGMFQPEAIKLFLFDAYHDWMPDTLRYVFMVGDANYNYKAAAARYGRNYVPAYGNPVSDIWFVSFDSSEVRPSISIGRLPVSTPAQITDYLAKHRRYLDEDYDLWNKSSLHFSGGFGEQDYAFYASVNWQLIDQLVTPPAYAGRSTHFYKTAEPQTDFGPYTREFVRDRIDEGGVFISYIGHSGTKTWDNSISETSQLINARNRATLLTDFGCSTGKFAEPDIESFSELFVSTGEDNHAIVYIGNASAGFENTLLTMPTFFYGALLRDGILRMGDAHRKSKNELIGKYGESLTNNVAVQTNTLIGDPVVALALPQQPNPVIRPNWIRAEADILTDRMDTLRFRFAVGNYGQKTVDSMRIRIEAFDAGATWHSEERTVALPMVFDSLTVAVPSTKTAGQNGLRVTLDIDGAIEEMSEEDNVAEHAFDILSTYLNVVDETLGREKRGSGAMQILNPLNDPGPIADVVFEFAPTAEFTAVETVREPYGKTLTALEDAPIPSGQKRYWRARLDNTQEFVGPFVRWEGAPEADYIQSDSTTFIMNARTRINVRSDRVELPPAVRTLNLESSGENTGRFGAVQVDYGPNVFPNSFFSGYGVAVLDSATLEVLRSRIFYTWGNAANRDSLRVYIENVQFGEIAAIVIADEGSRGAGTFLNAMKSIGSVYIDSVARSNRSAWAIIGRRGAAPGTVPEDFRRGDSGERVKLDTTIAVVPDTGTIVSTTIGPAAAWQTVSLERSPVGASTVQLAVIGIDTLGAEEVLLTPGNVREADISGIDAARYPHIRLRAALVPGVGEEPFIDSWAVAYAQPPELALNYQSVRLEQDTVDQGEPAEIAIGILNAGEAASGTFPVVVDVVGEDNIPRQAAKFTVAELPAGNWFDSTITVNTDFMRGAQQVFIRVDRDGVVAEQFEDNNTFITGFAVRPDTSRPQIDVTFDGYTPIDGDYIRYNPEVRVTLGSNSPLPIESVDNFTVTVDGQELDFDSLDYQFTPSTKENPATLLFQPELEDGVYYFGFNGIDGKDVPVYEETPELRLRVSTANRIEELYNYPNPFAGETAFTFLLTGAEPPRDLRVKIYTVAGRLIRVLTFPASSMRIGYNALKWDGRDEDGDELANGVYFYKVIAEFTDNTFEQIGRMAVMR
ncbi:MAG: C25 family cysteine peptidase, partial [Bacteroidota bacterium]|nr:C25 family cysteine peptidase [Bacteroidota bacterium]